MSTAPLLHRQLRAAWHFTEARILNHIWRGSYMLRKVLLAIMTMVAAMGFAFAQADVNKADQAALDSVKGIGPKTSKAILEERKKGGEFKDWTDLEKRVKGVGGKSAEKLSGVGLTVNGQSKPRTTVAAKDEKKDRAKGEAGKDAKVADAKDARKDAKKDEPGK
jgi:competence protein ComEA